MAYFNGKKIISVVHAQGGGGGDLSAIRQAVYNATHYEGELTDEELPKKIEQIGEYLLGAKKLSETLVYLGTTIRASSITNENHARVYFPNLKELPRGMFSNNWITKIEKGDFPVLEKINGSCFDASQVLSKVELPETFIGFYNGYNFMNAPIKALILHSHSVVVLSGSYNFRYSGLAEKTGYIYVPDDLVEEYKVATNWVTYASLIKPLSEYVEE